MMIGKRISVLLYIGVAFYLIGAVVHIFGLTLFPWFVSVLYSPYHDTLIAISSLAMAILFWQGARHPEKKELIDAIMYVAIVCSPLIIAMGLFVNFQSYGDGAEIKSVEAVIEGSMGLILGFLLFWFNGSNKGKNMTQVEFDDFKKNLFLKFSSSYEGVREKLSEKDQFRLDDEIRYYALVCSPEELGNGRKDGIVIMGIISLIEAMMSEEDFQDPFSYFKKTRPGQNAIEDVDAFALEYYSHFGASKKFRNYINSYISQAALDRLMSGIVIYDNSKMEDKNGRPLSSVAELAEFFYSLRSSFVHNARLPLMNQDNSSAMIDSVYYRKKERIVANHITVKYMISVFEESFVRFWQQKADGEARFFQGKSGRV